VKNESYTQTRTAADPLPDDLRNAAIKIRADVRTNVSQVGPATPQPCRFVREH
jgi:hypothetical protein